METKILEVRDEATMMLMLCVNMNPGSDYERKALRREGYPCSGQPNILMTRLSGHGEASNDPYGWHTSARTVPQAHDFIIKHWADLNDGDVVDVEFILGEATTMKVSEVA